MTANLGQSWLVILEVLCDSSKNEDCHLGGFSGANTGRLTCDMSPLSLFARRSGCVSSFLLTVLKKCVIFLCVFEGCKQLWTAWSWS